MATTLEHNLIHVKEALDKLLSQDWDKERIQYIVQAFAKSVQVTEDNLWALYSQRSLDTAEGAQLDAIGEIVDLNRGDLTDTEYRDRLRAKIRANRSFGQADDLLSIVALVAPDAEDVDCKDEPPAAVRVTAKALTISQVEALALFLTLAKGAGIQLTFVYSTSPAASTFTFADYGATIPVLGDGTGFDDGALSGVVGA